MNESSQTQRRIGVLDIGSNSVRFVIYELFGAAFTSIYNEKVLAGLGRDLRVTGRLNPEGRDEALKAIERFRTLADAHGLVNIIIGATAAMREATDASKFIQHVKAATGWDIVPLSGLDEAYFTAQGVIASEPRANGIAADLGGASLELIQLKKGVVKKGMSFPVGPFQIVGQDLSLTDDWDVKKIKAVLMDELKEYDLPGGERQTLFLIGGAWRNLAMIHQARHSYPLKTVQAYQLMPGAAKDLIKWAYGKGRQDLLNWPGLSARRAETLPYGAVLLDVLIRLYKPKKIVFSSTGLREGLVYDSLDSSLQSRDALLDGCRDLARGNLQGQHFAEPLFEFLKPLAEVTPPAFKDEDETRLRLAACHLVGIGKGLHADYRAGLVFEDVLYAPLAALTHPERAYLALILFHSFTNKTQTPNDAAIHLLLTLSQRKTAQTLGTAIRLAVVASGRSPELLRKYQIDCRDNTLTLKLSDTHPQLLTERVIYRLNKLGQAAEIATDAIVTELQEN